MINTQFQYDPFFGCRFLHRGLTDKLDLLPARTGKRIALKGLVRIAKKKGRAIATAKAKAIAHVKDLAILKKKAS
jgi:hypothetical protein